MNDSLFEPLHAGALRLLNRIVMAPLTRCRASAERVLSLHEDMERLDAEARA